MFSQIKGERMDMQVRIGVTQSWFPLQRTKTLHIGGGGGGGEMRTWHVG